MISNARTCVSPFRDPTGDEGGGGGPCVTFKARDTITRGGASHGGAWREVIEWPTL